MNTKEPFVITLSREVGSGGHTVGAILADKLEARYCDKQLLKALEKKFNLNAREIEKLKGTKKNWLADFIYKITPVPSASALGLTIRSNPFYSIIFTVVLLLAWPVLKLFIKQRQR